MRKQSKLPRNALMRNFAKDEKGGVAIVMGLSIIPLVLASGIAADYAITHSAKTRMDAAADAAALAGIKATQTTYAMLSQTNPNPGPAARAAGLAQAEKSFYAQAGKRAADLLGKPTINLVINGQDVTAQVAYNAQTPSNFGRIAGIKQMNYGGNAGATLKMPKFVDFYLLLDVSGSMGLPSTPDGEKALAAINTTDDPTYSGGGCRFACHQPGMKGFDLARANNIQLRIDAVGAAVANLMEAAEATKLVEKQYRVGVYPFITHVNSFVDLTTNLRGDKSSVETAINYDPKTHMTDFGKLLDFLDDTKFVRDLNPNYVANPKIPADTVGIGAGGTHIDTVFKEISTKVTTVGDGSGSLKPMPFVFFVSDGMQNSQYYSIYSGWQEFWHANSVRAMDPAVCSALKARGVMVSVLEIPYPAFNPAYTDHSNQELKANAAQRNLPTALKACASSSKFYHVADTPENIAKAMDEMFRDAVDYAEARLTQ